MKAGYPFLFFLNKSTVVQGAQVTVSTSVVTYELQLAPLLLQPACLDADGYVASYNGH